MKKSTGFRNRTVFCFMCVNYLSCDILKRIKLLGPPRRSFILMSFFLISTDIYLNSSPVFWSFELNNSHGGFFSFKNNWLGKASQFSSIGVQAMKGPLVDNGRVGRIGLRLLLRWWRRWLRRLTSRVGAS